MGACGGKPQQQPQNTTNPTQQQQVQLIAQPKLPANLNTPDNRIAFILSEEVQKYLQNKHNGYEKVVPELIQEAHIQKTEIPQYHQLLTKAISLLPNDEKTKNFVTIANELLKQELTSIWNLHELWDTHDMQHELLAFGLLIDIKHMVGSISSQSPIWWNKEYFKSYYDQLQITEVDETIHEDIRDAVLIKRALKQKIDVRITELNEVQRKKIAEEKKQKLLALKSLQDQVISRAQMDDQEQKLHFVKQQNQHYATPI